MYAMKWKKKFATNLADERLLFTHKELLQMQLEKERF